MSLGPTGEIVCPFWRDPSAITGVKTCVGVASAVNDGKVHVDLMNQVVVSRMSMAEEPRGNDRPCEAESVGSVEWSQVKLIVDASAGPQ